jgi:hypothetical protein
MERPREQRWDAGGWGLCSAGRATGSTHAVHVPASMVAAGSSHDLGIGPSGGSGACCRVGDTSHVSPASAPRCVTEFHRSGRGGGDKASLAQGPRGPAQSGPRAGPIAIHAVDTDACGHSSRREIIPVQATHSATCSETPRKVLTVMHEFARERLALEVTTLLPAPRGITVLERLVAVRGVLQFIRPDHGPEFMALAAHGWLAQHQMVALGIDTICPLAEPVMSEYARFPLRGRSVGQARHLSEKRPHSGLSNSP